MSDKQPSDAKSSPAKLRMVSNERGSVLALVALLLVVFLGLAALAIDFGLLYVARGEAQRAADAAAHAGAGYLMHNPNATEAEIKAEAVRVGERNLVRGERTEIVPEDDVDVLWDERKVRVRVHRTNERGNPVGTLLAQVIGFGNMDVAASAAAQIWPGVATDCILPFAIPDLWYVREEDGGLRPARIDDVWDKDRGDVYVPADGDHDSSLGSPPYTGYGTLRIGDPIQISPASQNESPMASWYYQIDLPEFSNLRDAIKGCASEEVYETGDSIYIDTGFSVGQVRQGFEDIFNDPDEKDIVWDYDEECPVRTAGGPCVGPESRRVRPVVMFDPRDWDDLKPGKQELRIQTMGGVFIDDWDENTGIIVRWMSYDAT